jgi:hypothetical protein
MLTEDELLVFEDGRRVQQRVIRRSELGATIARLAGRHSGSVRLEVHEADGSILADIITAEPKDDAEAAAASRTPTPDAPDDEWMEIGGDGYVPGEDVALALIIRHTSARADGHARALLGRNELPAIASEAILLGRVSGTITIVRMS